MAFTIHGLTSSGKLPAAAKSDLAVDIETPGSPVRDAVYSASEVAAREFGGVPPVVFQDFRDMADGPIHATAPALGPVWTGTGNTPPYVESGALTSSGTGYAAVTLAEQPESMWADVAFAGGTDRSSRPMTMAWCLNGGSDMLSNIGVHFNWGPREFTVESRKDGEDPFPRLMGGPWVREVPVGEYARVGAVVQGSTLTIFGPNGEIRTVTDPRIAELSGPTVFWEPRAVGEHRAYIRYVMATTRNPGVLGNGFATFAEMAGAGFGTDGSLRAVGSPETMAEVAMGRDPDTKMPSVAFGANKIRTQLAADVAVGSTTVTTDEIFPSGATLVIDSGGVVETVTAAAYSSGSAAPYTTTLSAPLAYAHPQGTVVEGSPGDKSRTKMYYNASNGYFYFPNRPVVVFPGEKAYLGAQLDTHILRLAAGVSGTHSSNGWRTGRFTTASRPSASAFGQGTQIFDTTLNKPLWSNGTAWVDASGAVV